MRERVDTRLEGLVREAADAFAAGDYAAAHRLALDGLARGPDDLKALDLAARASAQLELDDAPALLRRLSDRTPDDATVWRDLGLTLVGEGDLVGAERALREALRLGGADTSARIALAHVAYARGDVDGALAVLRVAAAQSTEVEPARSLLEMCRAAGRSRDALQAAETLLARQPGDVLALLDLADLHLELGDFDDAVKAFRSLLDADDEPGHAVYAYHGMIEVEMRRDRWRRALDLAISATGLDRHQLTTDVLAFVTAQLFGEADRPAPARDELEDRLARHRLQHRQAHLDSLLP